MPKACMWKALQHDAAPSHREAQHDTTMHDTTMQVIVKAWSRLAFNWQISEHRGSSPKRLK